MFYLFLNNEEYPEGSLPKHLKKLKRDRSEIPYMTDCTFSWQDALHLATNYLDDNEIVITDDDYFIEKIVSAAVVAD